jgi:hypothetical protein
MCHVSMARDTPIPAGIRIGMLETMPHRFRVKDHVSVARFAVRDTNALRRVVPLVVT